MESRRWKCMELRLEGYCTKLYQYLFNTTYLAGQFLPLNTQDLIISCCLWPALYLLPSVRLAKDSMKKNSYWTSSGTDSLARNLSVSSVAAGWVLSAGPVPGSSLFLLFPIPFWAASVGVRCRLQDCALYRIHTFVHHCIIILYSTRSDPVHGTLLFPPIPWVPTNATAGIFVWVVSGHTGGLVEGPHAGALRVLPGLLGAGTPTLGAHVAHHVAAVDLVLVTHRDRREPQL